jgi:alcohol dehydrogenase
VQFRKLDPARLMTDRFRFDQILDAYDAFARAPAMRALEAPTEFN